MTKSFTINLKIDYYDDPEGDKDRVKAKAQREKILPPGSFWQAAVGAITDSENRVLNKISAFQWDVLVDNGGLKGLFGDLKTMIPRLLDENGLPHV